MLYDSSITFAASGKVHKCSVIDGYILYFLHLDLWPTCVDFFSQGSHYSFSG